MTLAGPIGGIPTVGAVPTGLVANAVNVKNPDSAYGWAVQGGIKVNLPMIAPGDLFYLQAAYGDGALAYTGVGRFQGFYNQTVTASGRFAVGTNDAVVMPWGEVEKVKSWSVVAAFLHYWTPQLRSALFGGYGKVDYPDAARGLSFLPGAPTTTVVGGACDLTCTTRAFLFNSTLKDWSQIYVGSNLIWSPVRDLDIGVETIYSRFRVDGPVADANFFGATGATTQGVLPGTNIFGLPLGTPAKVTRTDDVFMGRFRIQRDF